MKKTFKSVIIIVCAFFLAGCAKEGTAVNTGEAVVIVLSDDEITVDGAGISESASETIYVARDIVYYPEGKHFTFGEGTQEDAYSEKEANNHRVVHITKPGTYVLSGEMSAGQIAVDLGDNAKYNPDAVVTLVLDNADITCSVAPAVIFYNVYECSDDEPETATKDADTTAAGANVVIADGTENNIHGSYVARIYESYELSEDGTRVVDSKKLHKYDAAFYSRKSMNIYGGEEGTGILNIYAENEGIGSELHLTVHGGNINITSGNDGINTNQDGVSVITINGGSVNVLVTGSTGEGDGIDSNGWLVVNGGTVIAQACGFSMDAGVDSDKGIHVNGGTVMATGNMLDRIADSGQNYAVFTFSNMQKAGSAYVLKDASGEEVLTYAPANDFRIMILSSVDMGEGTYTLWRDNEQLSAEASAEIKIVDGPNYFQVTNVDK